MSAEQVGPVAGPEQEDQNENESRRRILIAVLFLLLSFLCIFCSSQSALYLIDRDQIPDHMRSALEADYGPQVPILFSQVDRDRIIAEIIGDEEDLQNIPSILAAGGGVAIAGLPKATPQPTPTPFAVALIPTPTASPTPTAVPATNSDPPVDVEPSLPVSSPTDAPSPPPPSITDTPLPPPVTDTPLPPPTASPPPLPTNTPLPPPTPPPPPPPPPTSPPPSPTDTPVPANNPPVAVNDPNNTTAEENLLAITVMSNDFDPDLDPITIASVGLSPNGVITNNVTSVTYVPNLDFNGTDTFTYTITDGSLTDTATVAITVTAVNDAPVANDDFATTNQDFFVDVDVVTASDFDVDGNLDLTSITPTIPPNGSAVAGPAGLIRYTPDPGFSGLDIFDYDICDVSPPLPAPLCDTATVTVTVVDTVPAAPTNLRAAAGDEQISLGWDHTPEADLAGYRVYRSDGGGPFNLVATTPVVTRYVDQSLTNGVTYAYRVTAIDAGANESGPSNTASATPAPMPVTFTTDVTCSGAVVTGCASAEGPPDNVSAVITGTGQILFDFDPSATGTGIIDGAGFDVVFYEFFDVSSVFLDYTLVELSPDGTTWYPVFEWNGDPGTSTDIRGTSVDSAASDADGEAENEIIPQGLLYPFPGTGIAIDIGAVLVPPPAGVPYRYVRISYPSGGTDAAQIDAVERLN